MDGPFRVSAAILGIKMQTLMATVALLQLFNIFPKQGSCSKCSKKTSSDVKADGNYIYWWCSSCRVKTPIRRGTVLSNSNLKLERFVLLMFAFVHRGNTYIQIANDARLPTTLGYKECSMSFSTISRWFKYFTYICGKDYDESDQKIGGKGEILIFCLKLTFSSNLIISSNLTISSTLFEFW